MKHLAISAALAAGLGLAAINPAQAANDGVIKIDGHVTSITCKIEGLDPGENKVVKEVHLLGVPAEKLDAPGKSGGDKLVTIKVGGDGSSACQDGHNAYVRFDPTSKAIDTTTGRLNNTLTPGSTVAANVQIQFLNPDDSSVIDLRNDDSKGYLIAGNEANIPMVVRMYANGAAATAGLVESEVGFQVVFD